MSVATGDGADVGARTGRPEGKGVGADDGSNRGAMDEVIEAVLSTAFTPIFKAAANEGSARTVATPAAADADEFEVVATPTETRQTTTWRRERRLEPGEGTLSTLNLSRGPNVAVKIVSRVIFCGGVGAAAAAISTEAITTRRLPEVGASEVEGSCVGKGLGCSEGKGENVEGLGEGTGDGCD